MSEELNKDLDFIAEVVKEFVEKHKELLGSTGYMNIGHLYGCISIYNSNSSPTNIDYFKKISEIREN